MSLLEFPSRPENEGVGTELASVSHKVRLRHKSCPSTESAPERTGSVRCPSLGCKARSRKHPMSFPQDSDHARLQWGGTMKPRPVTVAVMTHKIVTFHLDEHSDWVAQLECGHEQHVGHTPLWNYRYWLTTPQGRLEYLGQELNCLECLP
jgi:hypothetical protein